MKRSYCVFLGLTGLALCAPACSRQEKNQQRMAVSETISLANGLRYQIITPAAGQAASPIRGKVVRVHYTGWLNDGKDGLGKKFDSSVDRGQPFEFPLGVGYVIQGWDLGVADMKIGETRRLFIPSALGYGVRGAGAVIPPNADLIFDVQLIA